MIRAVRPVSREAPPGGNPPGYRVGPSPDRGLAVLACLPQPSLAQVLQGLAAGALFASAGRKRPQGVKLCLSTLGGRPLTRLAGEVSHVVRLEATPFATAQFFQLKRADRDTLQVNHFLAEGFEHTAHLAFHPLADTNMACRGSVAILALLVAFLVHEERVDFWTPLFCEVLVCVGKVGACYLLHLYYGHLEPKEKEEANQDEESG